MLLTFFQSCNSVFSSECFELHFSKVVSEEYIVQLLGLTYRNKKNASFILQIKETFIKAHKTLEHIIKTLIQYK
jgi:hypothetical protein